MEKMKREDMAYNKAKLVCSNCDEGSRNDGQDIYTCHKMADESNWVQPHGFCDFHSAKELDKMMSAARDGYKTKN